MFIDVPDDSPGRCKNYRWIGHESVRCLDYEHSQHVCEFPKPITTEVAGAGQTYTKTQPSAWVRPENQHYETVVSCSGCVNGVTLGRKPRKCTECQNGFKIEMSVPPELRNA